MRRRLGVIVSHPIQYHAPLYARLGSSEVLDLEVLFLSDHGVHPTYDPGFGQTFIYDTPLLDGYEHRFVPNRSPRPSVASFVGLMNPAILQEIRSRRFDALLVHGWAHVSEWLALAGAGLTRVPYMLRGETWPDGSQQGLRRSVKRGLLGPLVRSASACLAIGARNREFYLSYGADSSRIHRVPYAVDNDFFAQKAAIGREAGVTMLSELGLDPELPTVLYAAKLMPRKRPLDVVRAVGLMDAPVNVVFIGDGELRADLDRAARQRNRVRVLGFRNQRELGEWYGVADVFVLPSSSEPWGLAVNEAMAGSCVPIVSDQVGCAPDLITPASGRVFPTGDVASLAGAMYDVVRDSTTMVRMGEAARAQVASFSIAAAARGIEEAVVRVCERRLG